MSSDTDGAETADRFLKSLRALMVASAAQGSDARRVREEALAAIGEWSGTAGAAGGDVDVSHSLRGITAGDRELLGNALHVFDAWVQEPGEESGKRVDDVIARVRRELGPLIARDREAEEAAERERLGNEIRGAISRRLRQAGAVRSDDE
ncbi:hypothetical protein [Streptomyces sp. CB01580]|uniref:hypothetical protein n=1 Tax=Streptomyces sp. CB01580 TaxID=1703933 RepID=UPI00093AF7A4|nr:hypothetical protein [Streptomyces sp. CB01580]OKJ39975.1 hypothetical protein AMK22_10415 [Streptomyces sp. CB01580]